MVALLKNTSTRPPVRVSPLTDWTLPAVTEKLHELAAIPVSSFPGSLRDLYVWLVQTIRYSPDNPQIDRFQGPLLTLSRGAGDCEDIALVAVAMTRAPAVLRIYGREKVPDHIAAIIDGVPIDAAARPGFGREWPGYDSIYDVRVR